MPSDSVTAALQLPTWHKTKEVHVHFEDSRQTTKNLIIRIQQENSNALIV